MRQRKVQKLGAIFVMMAAVCPAFGATRVTVSQLEQSLTAIRGNRDAAVARQLAGLELTERLTTVKLADLETTLGGRKAREALTALADASAFLDLPESEIPQAGKPDLASQEQITSLAVRYVESSIRSMPNFYATRVTTRFEGMSQNATNNELSTNAKGFHLEDSLRVTVLYRVGQEVVIADGVNKTVNYPDHGLNNSGVFGPILSAVMADAQHGRITWSRWEASAAGPLAVFNYVVPLSESHYRAQYCCVYAGIGTSSFNSVRRSFQGAPAYHGELAIEPASGRILRLVVQPELKSDLPIVRDDVMVEYGPVVIGGQTYICPTKSVAISKAEKGGGWEGSLRWL